MLDEALQVIKALWMQDTANFDGTCFRLEDAVCNPKPAQKPHPPIIVAGHGEKKSLRVVARHATEWNAASADIGNPQPRPQRRVLGDKPDPVQPPRRGAARPRRHQRAGRGLGMQDQ